GWRTGAQESMLVTYVPRAEKAGAIVLARTRAERVRVEAGAVRGVEAVQLDPATGAPGETVTIDAPPVFVAAGGMGTPAPLLRSGIPGGPGHRIALPTTTPPIPPFP